MSEDTSEAPVGLTTSEEEPEPKPKKRSSLRHDLRTPINQIIGYSEMLAEDAEDDGQEKYIPDLGRIRTAAGNLLELIDKIPLVDEPLPVSKPSPSSSSAELSRAEDESPPEVKSGEYVPPAQYESEEEESKPAHLLIVDDIELNRSMLGRRFDKRGFKVTLADGGQDALDKLKDGDFDLVLLDIMMPDISGYDVLERVRKTSSSLTLPIVMVTAKDQGEDVVQAFKMGANDYITKPVDFKVALIRVETLLSRKRALEKAQRLTQELERHNQFIRKTFGRYLSKEVVDGILSSPEGLKLGGEKRQITILMSDLRGFSSLSETRDPETIVEMLNNYLGKMADIVTMYGGTIDEFIGDAILALFGAPIQKDDDPERAVACAIEMQQAMKEVNEDNARLGLPELEMGIAVNTGECVVGNIGSTQRAKYGVVGQHVNLAGRIESYTIGGQILISSSTVDGVESTLSLGPETKLAAKGFREPVAVYEVFGIEGAHNLTLEQREETLKDLIREITVSVGVLEGKHVSGSELQGQLVSLSMHAADLVVDAEAKIGRFTNLKLSVRGLNEVILPEDLYAKVISAEGNRFRVQFTSIPETVKSYLRSALAKEVSGDTQA